MQVIQPIAAGRPVRRLRAIALVVLAIGLQPVLPPHAHAQDADTESVRQYHIPAGPLDEVLNTFADQAGLLLSADASLTGGRHSDGLRGNYTPRDGLDRLLAGSGLRARFIDDRTVALERTPDASTQLQPLTITAASLRDDLPTAYIGGQVATGGKLGMLGNTDFMDAPFSVTSYTSELIEEQQARSLANIADNDPSVQIGVRGRRNNSGGDNFRIRGFNLFTADTSLNGLYGVLPANTISTETVERVEIIKGPNALLTGITPGGRVGGSINLVPKRANETPLTRVRGLYRSDAQFGTHLDVGRRFGAENRFGVRFNGVYTDGDTAVRDQSQTLGLVSLGVDYRGERLRVSGDFGYQKDRVRGASGFGSGLQVSEGVAVPDAPDASKRTAQSWERTENEDVYAALHAEYDFTPQVTIYGGAGGRNNTPYNLRTNHTLLDDDGTLRSFPVYYPEYSDTRTAMSGLRARFNTGSISHRVNLQASLLNIEGGFLYEAGDPFISDLNQVGRIARPDDFALSRNIPKTYERNLSSIAVADTLGFLDDRLLLTLGARHQRVEIDNFDPDTGNRTSSYDESRTTPSVGVAFRPWHTVTLYSNYIEGLSLGYTAPANAENAGESFPPARTRQIEAGIKVDTGTLGGTLALFQIREPSVINKSGSSPDGFVSTLDGEQRNRGIELHLFGSLTPDLTVLGGVTYLQPTLTHTQDGINDGNDAPGVSRWLTNLTLRWDTPFAPGFSLHSRIIRSSSQYTNAANTQKIPGWTRLDLGASYRLPSYPVTLRANIENVLDDDYWESAAGSGGRLRLAEPRLISLSASVDF